MHFHNNIPFDYTTGKYQCHDIMCIFSFRLIMINRKIMMDLQLLKNLMFRNKCNPIRSELTSLSLSQRSPLIYGVNFIRLWPFFYSHLFIIFGVGLPAYLSNHNPFSREHIFVSFNEFPSLVYWCTVIHHHRPQGPTLFQRARWDCVICAQTQDLLF